MTREETLSLERLIGRLEKSVSTLEQQSRDQGDRCTKHWDITNGLVRSLAESRTANEAVSAEAKNAREVVIADAVAAAATVAHDAASSATARADRDAIVLAAVTAVRDVVSADARDRQTGARWRVERVLPFFYPATAVVITYLLTRGG